MIGAESSWCLGHSFSIFFLLKQNALLLIVQREKQPSFLFHIGWCSTNKQFIALRDVIDGLTIFKVQLQRSIQDSACLSKQSTWLLPEGSPCALAPEYF